MVLRMIDHRGANFSLFFLFFWLCIVDVFRYFVSAEANIFGIFAILI
jgi:membrane-bound metal-dependent hydrolase YbcI (DUF457 family)